MPPQPQREPSFSEKMQMMENLMVFPALTVMVCLRKNLGYRLLNVFHLFIMAGILFVVSVLANDVPGMEALRWFAAVVLVFGIGQRIRRWIERWRGIQQHSYYIGDSMFEGKWLPQFLRRNRRFTPVL